MSNGFNEVESAGVFDGDLLESEETNNKYHVSRENHVI